MIRRPPRSTQSRSSAASDVYKRQVLGDKPYSARAHRTLLRSRGVKTVIPEPSNQIRNRLRRGSRGGRPPAFDSELYKGRNVVERSFNTVKQWRALATRYDKLAIVYRGAAVLRAITIWLKHLQRHALVPRLEEETGMRVLSSPRTGVKHLAQVVRARTATALGQ